MNEKYLAELYGDLDHWAMAEYGVPYEVAKNKSRGAKDEFKRLNIIGLKSRLFG